MVLTVQGRVYTFGEGLAGQLGHASKYYETLPRLVQAISHKRAVQIAAGGYHTLVLLHNGTVLYFGDNESGQTGTRTLNTLNTLKTTIKLQRHGYLHVYKGAHELKTQKLKAALYHRPEAWASMTKTNAHSSKFLPHMIASVDAKGLRLK